MIMRIHVDMNPKPCTPSIHRIYKLENGHVTCPVCQESLYRPNARKRKKRNTVESVVIKPKEREL